MGLIHSQEHIYSLGVQHLHGLNTYRRIFSSTVIFGGLPRSEDGDGHGTSDFAHKVNDVTRG